jgi:ankyrin repeat protein
LPNGGGWELGHICPTRYTGTGAKPQNEMHKYYKTLGPVQVLIILAAVAWNTVANCGEIADAARNRDWEKVKTLLKANPELVSDKGSLGKTPLIYAVADDQKDVVETLVANKADVNMGDEHGDSPLHWAATCGREEIARFLMMNKANVDVRNNNFQTPLHIAASDGRKDVAELLLNSNADVNAQDREYETPMHLAAGNGTPHPAG